MAEVTVTIDAAEKGDMPAISVKTGQPCTNAVAIPLRPGSHIWSMGKKILAVLPLEAGRARERRALGWISLLVLALFVAALVTIGVAIAGALLLIYAALVLVGDSRWIGAKTGADAGTIVLTKVHANFARAVEEQDGVTR
jgi:hypothetical protein